MLLRKCLTPSVNAILGDHNVDKQMTDSRGEVGTCHLETTCIAEGSRLHT